VNLILDPATGFYLPPLTPGAPVVYCSPDGTDANPGTEAAPVATLAAARKKLAKGKPGTIALKAGGRWTGQQLFIDGGAPDAPQIVTTYGGDERAVIDCSKPAPGEAAGKSAIQLRGPAFLSDLELPGEPGRAAAVQRGKFELVAQNVLIYDAGMAWDLSEGTVHLHRCLSLDIYDPKGDKSQGTYITKGALLASQSVWHRCGWKPGVPLTFFASDKNHCVYVDEDCPRPSAFEECWFGEPCSHGTQMRTGGTVRRSVYYRCPIGGFAQGPDGVIEDAYFEQQDAVQLGHGSCPTAELRGWGWDLESWTAQMHHCGFARGGGASPTARAIELSKTDPKRTPARTGAGIFVSATRVAGWTGGVKQNAPPSELGTIDVEVDGPAPRWPVFTADPYVETVRNLRRGSDWGIIARVASAGYASLEQVIPAAPSRAVTSAVAKALRAEAAALEKV
jgi:hypothetical protein